MNLGTFKKNNKVFSVVFLLFLSCVGGENSTETQQYSTPQELVWCSLQLEELADLYITPLDVYELASWSRELNILVEVIPLTNLRPFDVWYHEDIIPTGDDKIGTHLSKKKRNQVSDKLYETSSKMLEPVEEYDKLCNYWRANFEVNK